MPQELAFESLSVALESTRGTAVTPPTHGLNMEGQLTPMNEVYTPPDQLGRLAEIAREEVVRKWGEWEAEGGADVTKMTLIGNMALAALTAGVASGGNLLTTPVSAGGSGYTSAPTVGITAPAAGGRQATATATLTGDAVSAVTITDPGRGYTAAPTISFSGGGGTDAAVASPTVSAVTVTAKEWEFVRAMTADTIKSATLYWGDPNVAIYKATYAMLQEFTVSGDASSTDGVTLSASGISQFPDDLTGGSIPALPAISVGPLLVSSAMQLWMEPNTTAPFGTTAVTGRVVSAEVTVPTGVTPKYVAVGPTGGITFDHVGREKTHPELKIVVEMLDQTQYDLYQNGTTVKARIKFNNTTAIEGSVYPALYFDVQGKLSGFSWGELEGVNRTMEFTIRGNYSAQIASDLRMGIIVAQAAI